MVKYQIFFVTSHYKMSSVVSLKKGKLKENKGIKKEKKEPNVWNKECEELLAEWSEKASCYRWLHGRCEKSYRTWYYCFSIPVIILSTLTGAANVGMDSFVPQENKSMASAIVGGVNIFAGIVSTLQNFLKVAELMEGHRIAGVSWGKLQRNIAIELALDPERRVIQSDFLKLSRAEYDRLIEAGPIIDDGVIKQFNKKFKNYQVSVPSICNGLDKCNIYKIDKESYESKYEYKYNSKYESEEDDLIDGIEDIITPEEKEYNKKMGKINNGIDNKDSKIEVKIDQLNIVKEKKKKEDVDDVDNKEDVKDVEDVEDVDNKEDVEDVEDVDNKENVEDVEELIPIKKVSNDKKIQTNNIDEEIDEEDKEDDLTNGL